MTAPGRDRTGFVDALAQLRRRWAVVAGGGLLGTVAGVAATQALPGLSDRSFGATSSLVILLAFVVAGLIVGTLCGLVVVHLQPRVTTVADVRRVTGLPVIAQLPSAALDGDVLDDRVTSGRMRTSLREAVLNTRSLAGGHLPERLVIARTDSVDESKGLDGGIARALVDSGFVPALVQTDFESRLVVRPSTIEFAAGEASSRRDASGYERIPVPDRVASARPDALLAAIDDFFQQLAERYDVSIAQASSDSFPVALRDVVPVASAVVIVVRSNRTSIEALLSLQGELLALGSHPLGVVMTGVAPRHRVLLRETWVPADFLPDVSRAASASSSPASAPALSTRRPTVSIADLVDLPPDPSPSEPPTAREDQP